MSDDDKLNTIFEQDGKVWAICMNECKDLSRFISSELRYMRKSVPRGQMRVVTTADFKQMPFGAPSKT